MPDSDSDDDLFADSTAETTSNTAALFGVLDLLDGAAEEPQDFAAVLAGAPEAVSLGVGDGGAPAQPVVAGAPSVVDDYDQRSTSAQHATGVENGMGERQDDERS